MNPDPSSDQSALVPAVPHQTAGDWDTLTATPGHEPYLAVRDLCREYVGGGGVHGVSFDINEGELVTLVGPSGCGKTTTLRCLAGIERINSGVIRIDGRIVSSPREKVFVPTERRDLGMVFQSYALWPHMSVWQNVAYPLRVRKIAKQLCREKVDEILEVVGLLDMANRFPGQLSGGQQQRVALARALVYRPKLLLLDEPLSNLDAQLRETMRRDIRRIQQQLGITAVYVTHDRTEALTMSDKAIVMSGGRVVQVGTPSALLHDPASGFVASLLGSANLLFGTVVSSDEGRHGTVCVAIKLADGAAMIQARRSVPLVKGSTATVCVRPQDVNLKLARDVEPSTSELKGIIDDVVLNGVACEYVVDLGGVHVRAFTIEDLGLALGDPVLVSFDQEQTKCVPE